MALTTTFEGYGLVDRADSTTGWSVIKATGGGGTPSVALADGGIEGASAAQAVTATVNQKRILLYYDIGSGNELDFSVGGTEEGQSVYVWGNFLASSLLLARNSGGFGVMLGTQNGGTTDWSLYYFYGNDNYSGGWERMVIDPTKTASQTGQNTTQNSGTGITLSSVRYFGVFAETSNTARFDNLVCDAIHVGTGLRVTGTGTANDSFGDIISDEETVSNRWGVLNSLNSDNSILELNGKLTIGDNVGTGNGVFDDIDKVVSIANQRYYNGTSEVNSVPDNFFGIEIVGNGTGVTSVNLGEKVGTGDTASGRNGITFLGNNNYTTGIDFDDGNVDLLYIYGTTFSNLTGVLSWGTTAGHECIGNTFNACSQFDPVGGIEIRDCTFVNTKDVDAALLWNGSIDIKNSAFIANTTGAGIEHSAQGTFSYTGLNFSGNTDDILYSAAASSGVLTINALAGSDPVSSEIANATGNSVTINNAVTLRVTATTTNSAPISGARVLLKTTAFTTTSSLTASGTTATAVTSSAHGLTTGQKALISGAEEDEYNKVAVVTVTNSTTFTYTIDSGASSPATPTNISITVQKVLLDGATNGSGVIEDTGYNYIADETVAGVVRQGSSAPYYKTSRITGSITTNGFDQTILLISDE